MLIIPGADEAQAAAANEDPTNTEDPTQTEEIIDPTEELETETAPETAPDLTQELAAEREQRIRLEERLAAQEAKPGPAAVEPPKELTRVQLREAVDNGQIDQDQMETLWADQERAKTRREVAADNDARDRERQTTSVIQTDTAKYLESHPEIRTQGSSDWNRLKSEYDYLVSLGDKDNKTTELKAMRAAFGPHPIRESSSRRRQTPSETSTSQGGAGGDGRSANIWTKVPEHLRVPYKKMVSDGVMTLEDVKKDIPYMKDQPS